MSKTCIQETRRYITPILPNPLKRPVLMRLYKRPAKKLFVSKEKDQYPFPSPQRFREEFEAKYLHYTRHAGDDTARLARVQELIKQQVADNHLALHSLLGDKKQYKWHHPQPKLKKSVSFDNADAFIAALEERIKEKNTAMPIYKEQSLFSFKADEIETPALEANMPSINDDQKQAITALYDENGAAELFTKKREERLKSLWTNLASVARNTGHTAKSFIVEIELTMFLRRKEMALEKKIERKAEAATQQNAQVQQEPHRLLKQPEPEVVTPAAPIAEAEPQPILSPITTTPVAQDRIENRIESTEKMARRGRFHAVSIAVACALAIAGFIGLKKHNKLPISTPTAKTAMTPKTITSPIVGAQDLEQAFGLQSFQPQFYPVTDTTVLGTPPEAPEAPQPAKPLIATTQTPVETVKPVRKTVKAKPASQDSALRKAAVTDSLIKHFNLDVTLPKLVLSDSAALTRPVTIATLPQLKLRELKAEAQVITPVLPADTLVKPTLTLPEWRVSPAAQPAQNAPQPQ